MYKLDARFIGYPLIEQLQPVAGPTGQPWPPLAPGIVATADDPVWGPGEFIWAKYGGSVRQYGLCVLTPTWNATTRQFDMLMTEVTNVAIQGRPVYIAMAEVGSAGALVNQYGWFMQAGQAPVNGTASVAAGAGFGVTAAGQIGAIAAGKQVAGVVAQAATATVVTAMITGIYGKLGDNKVQVANLAGLFVGGYVAGTGIAAASFIQAIDRSQATANILTLSAVTTADVAGNLTQTNNNATIFYNEVSINRPQIQGAIT